ncbi:MAG: right-handed parallel beta-helix repeat-containing protein [Nocardioides sp.]|uniref:right-handed parallel beta-helix repeat-containing protein n=1 Tax=Nocardioides sp. TaxID=35761 RepID=UPI003D6A9699
MHITDEPRGGRRSLLRGATIAGAAALAVGAPAGTARAEDGRTRNFGLRTVSPDEDFGAALAATPQVQLVPGAAYTLPAAVELPDECLIIGNGATITVPSFSSGALHMTGRSDVTIRDVRFLGQTNSPLNTPPAFDHVAIRVTRSTNVRILDCDFENWRGCGVAVSGSTSDDYFAYRVKVLGNAFVRCYFGLSATDRSEYSQAASNSFTYCRLAVWNSSGNWMVNDNDIVGCYGAYYCASRTSPYGTASSDNWAHGSFAGNTANHSNGGAKELWSVGVAFPVGGVEQDLGRGVVISSVLPPTFSGNTLWYTDIRASDLVGTRWLISGCTLSNLTVTANGSVPIALVGTQSNGIANAPHLIGNAKDLLASLY